MVVVVVVVVVVVGKKGAPDRSSRNTRARPLPTAGSSLLRLLLRAAGIGLLLLLLRAAGIGMLLLLLLRAADIGLLLLLLLRAASLLLQLLLLRTGGIGTRLSVLVVSVLVVSVLVISVLVVSVLVLGLGRRHILLLLLGRFRHGVVVPVIRVEKHLVVDLCLRACSTFRDLPGDYDLAAPGHLQQRLDIVDVLPIRLCVI